MKKFIPLIAILVLLFSALIISTYKNVEAKKTVRLLPTFGNKLLTNTDTVYHTIQNFSFVNQLGNTITEKDLVNCNYVVEYFFTTCQSICPIMNTNMMKVAKTFDADSSFRILSHTVKPEEDSVTVLFNYANAHEANHHNWWFLTGNKKELYDLARRSYLMNNEEGSGDEDDFIHTQMFALIDKDRHIRGFYDGTVSSEVDQLISDIRLLKKEQDENQR